MQDEQCYAHAAIICINNSLPAWFIHEIDGIPLDLCFQISARYARRFMNKPG